MNIISSFFYRKRLRWVREEWGKERNGKRDFKSIGSLFESLIKHNDKNRFYIDDQSWEDLNMNQLYSKLDRTFSFCGKQGLYNMLRTPFLEEEGLKKRDKIIDFFKDNTEKRERVLIELTKLDVRDTGVVELFFSELEENKWLKILYSVLAIIPLALGILIYIYGIKSKFVPYLICSLIINSVIHYKSEGKLNYRINAMSTVSKIIKVAKNISKLNVYEIGEYNKKLEDYTKKCSGISKNSSSLGQIEGLDSIMEYFNIAFLVKERAYFSLANEINNHKDELKEIYILLGELEALISTASFRKQYGDKLIKPILSNEGKFIKAKNITHPIIDEPVANSIHMVDKGIILTGSNMSGKSTFLRTIGVNALLAQTIYNCSAESYEASYFKVITSISPEDNLVSGKSYYFGEVESLLRIIKSEGENIPTLSLIDEIFRGTNPIERVSAATEILKYLNEHNTLVAVATHDLELTKLLKDKYDCYYFREEVKDDKLIFDYLIKEGVSPTRNAIRILSMMGYPQEIVDNAELRISSCE